MIRERLIVVAKRGKLQLTLEAWRRVQQRAKIAARNMETRIRAARRRA